MLSACCCPVLLFYHVIYHQSQRYSCSSHTVTQCSLAERGCDALVFGCIQDRCLFRSQTGWKGTQRRLRCRICVIRILKVSRDLEVVIKVCCLFIETPPPSRDPACVSVVDTLLESISLAQSCTEHTQGFIEIIHVCKCHHEHWLFIDHTFIYSNILHPYGNMIRFCNSHLNLNHFQIVCHKATSQ